MIAAMMPRKQTFVSLDVLQPKQDELTENTIRRLVDMPTLLHTDHGGMVRRKERRELVTRHRVYVVIHRGGRH
jgi:hypothetical protein